MAKTAPVGDWATDYDIFDPGYVRDPVPIWRELRQTCPIARTERWGGSWLPTRYEDMQAFVRMVPALSSKEPIVVPTPETDDPENDEHGLDAPPITSDPPEQIPMRRLILPFFTPKAVAVHRPYTEQLCHQLIDDFIERGACDAAVQYAQQIPPRIIAHVIGVDPDRSADFVEWVRGVLELGLSQPDTLDSLATFETSREDLEVDVDHELVNEDGSDNEDGTNESSHERDAMGPDHRRYLAGRQERHRATYDRNKDEEELRKAKDQVNALAAKKRKRVKV